MEPQTTILTKITRIPLRIILPALAFAIPFFVSGPQWLTGTLVNALILLVATNKLPQKHWYPVAVLPSLAALSHGILFGKFTPFLLYFLPFIWLGNLILMKSYIYVCKKTVPILAIIISGSCKALFLYIFALILYQLKIVPGIFLASMGLIQLLTAIAGGMVAMKITKNAR